MNTGQNLTFLSNKVFNSTMSRRAVTISMKDLRWFHVQQQIYFHTSGSLLSLRVAKTHKISKVKPCSSELDEYIASLDGDERRLTTRLAKALADCMDYHVGSYSLQFTSLLTKVILAEKCAETSFIRIPPIQIRWPVGSERVARSANF